jgi:hypothetical protein
MIPIRLFVRAAGRLQRLWTHRANRADDDLENAFGRLEERYRALQASRRLLRQARLHSLTLSFPELRGQTLAQLHEFADLLDALRLQLEPPAWTTPTVADLLAELRQVEADFGEVQFDWRENCLAVTTEAITLEEVPLGAFTVELYWQRLGSRCDSSCFEIVALHPNPPRTDERVTHPHVLNQRLCAGDAARPLARALEQGRLADAFHLVASVLRHYNPDSPHVALDAWGGRECHDCGVTLHADGASWCERCDHDFCEDCTGSCAVCASIRCHRCLRICAVCQEPCCRGCLETTGAADRLCCPSCRSLCERCGAELPTDELHPESHGCPACQPAAQPTPEPTPTKSLTMIRPSEDLHASLS